MTDHDHSLLATPTRRSVLLGTLGAGVLVSGVTGLAGEALAGVPTASSRAALATSTGCATLTKEETQGPFWVDEQLKRSDIRYDTGSASTSSSPVAGVPLTFTLTLLDAGESCAPQVGAVVDVWHADAQGVYSDVSGSGNPDEVGHNFLRGYQVSDAEGQVTFTTVVPGWYVSRTEHIHFRVRLSLDSSTTVDFTSQLFFDESVNTAVLATSAYAKSGTRDTTNSNDQLYDASLLLPLTGSPSAGYTGAFTVNLDFDDTSTTGSTGSTGTTTSDTVVAGSVSGVRVVRRRGRKVQVRVAGQERLAAKVRLVRHDDVLARTTTGWLAAGRHTVTLRVPRKVRAGTYSVLVTLADRAGNTKVVTRRVHVPRRG